LDGSRNFPRFTKVDENYFLDKTTFLLQANDETIENYLLGFLNSKNAEFMIYHTVMTLGESSLGLQKKYIEMIPIPMLDELEMKQVSKLVTEILNRKKQNQDTKLLENEIDNIFFNATSFTNIEMEFLENNFVYLQH